MFYGKLGKKMKPEPLNLDKSRLISISEFQELIIRISRTGHSFPHGCFCRTCESDCEEVIDFTFEKRLDNALNPRL